MICDTVCPEYYVVTLTRLASKTYNQQAKNSKRLDNLQVILLYKNSLTDKSLQEDPQETIAQIDPISESMRTKCTCSEYSRFFKQRAPPQDHGGTSAQPWGTF